MISLIGRHRSLINKLNRYASKLKSVNLTSPHLWFDETRKLKRKIICHIGPTNSGKTYTALQRLKESKCGLYCGPLRLLAWEVCETLRLENIKCNLITGNERELYECGGTHTSSTVEMVDLYKEYEVAVIDEAQLIGDPERGWAWTQAFLGVKAAEVHVCGSPTLLPIITALTNLTGDTIEVHTYKRLSPLNIQKKALNDLSRVQPGDCVVGFSRRMLFSFKAQIEKMNPAFRCCVIYGSLPPDARKQQAKLFNDPLSGYNILVASDAIGMGLNLAIRRIVFSSVEKFDGRCDRLLTTAEIKQIAGRAGRFGSIYNEGYVTCLDKDDVSVMKSSLEDRDTDIRRAGLFPTFDQIELLSLLLQYGVNELQLEAFWNIRFAELWDIECTSSSGFSGHNRSTASSIEEGSESDVDRGGVPVLTMQNINSYGLNHGVIVRHFGSVAKFNEDLSLYLASDRVNNPITYATNDTHVEDDFTNMKKGKRSKNIKNISEKKRRGRKIEIIDLPDNHRLHTSRGSNQRYLSLSYLMQQYRKHSELDPNGLYFLCHMKEVFELASVLDQYPQISLRDKYVWALAPVSIDNVIVMKSYKTYVHQFASNGIVYLDLTMEYDSRVPKDEIILLKYESMHKVFELYIWLSLRFEGHFPDKSDAEKERDICTSLIDKGLMNLGQIRKNTRKRVKRQSDRFDDIKMDAHMR